MDWFEPLVTRTPGVQGGSSVLDGTRTPVGTDVTHSRNFAGDLERLRAAFPHLTLRQIRAALAYYERNWAEVDADERRCEDAWEQLRRVV